MADELVLTTSDKPISEAQKAREFEEHTGTYKAFLVGFKWLTIVTVAILIFLYLVFIH